MGGQGGPTPCLHGGVGVLLLLALILTTSLAANESHFRDVDDSRTVPLPLLLESLRGDVLRGLSFGQDPVNVQRLQDSVELEAHIPWYSRSTRGEEDSAARDELQVTSVIKDDRFNYGEGVEKWLSLVVDSTTYLVGLGSSDLTLLTATFVTPEVNSGHTYSLSPPLKIPLEAAPLSGTVFKHWNAATKVFDAILVLAIDSPDGNLLWYRITNHGLEKIRSWPVHKKISYLNVFQVGDQMKLLMITPCDNTLKKSSCKASADIFDFSFGASLDPKLSQALSLEGEAVFSEIGVVGDDVYIALALPDAGIVKLYQYHWPAPSEGSANGNHSTHGWFEFWKDLPSPGVSHAIFFHVSYKMYLAVGGGTPALFRFVSPGRIDGCPQALQSFGFVSAWMVLPVQTYRDEVVLLAEVQHMEGSAMKRAVITLTWAGVGVFNQQNPPQCFVNGIQSEFRGVSCILADSGKLGLRGAITLQLSDASVVTVIVPKGRQPSALFRIRTQLQPIINPLLGEVRILKDAQLKLKGEIELQDLEISLTEEMLQNTLNPSESNVITGDWVIQEVTTPEYEVEIFDTVDLPGGIPVDPIDIEKLKSLLVELEVSTKTLLDSLSDAAVPVNGELHLYGTQTLLGGVEVAGQSTFKSLHVSRLNGESVPTLLKEAVRLDRVEKIGGTKTFSNLKMADVDFALINGVQKDDLIFNVPDKPIVIHGNLEFTQPLHVLGNVDLPPGGTVGGLDLSEEIFLPGRKFEGVVRFDEVTIEGDLTVDIINTVPMHPYNLRAIASGVHNWEENNGIQYNLLEVGGNLKVERINGYLWNDIVKRIVWKDSNHNISGLTIIDGTLKSNHGLDMWQLNSLDFPSDYVLKTTTSQHVTGKKNIQNQLMVGTVDIESTVDGVPVNSLVTLTTEQHLNGELKLQEADIIGDIKVDSAVNGIKLDHVLNQSPLIDEGGVVSSNVFFSHLEVDGPIQISNTLDEWTLKEYLLDVLILPSPDETVQITGKKTFNSTLEVSGLGITVSSGLANGKKIADIARLDSYQIFQGEKIIRQAVFQNIHLTGQWDGVNVVDLNAEAIRLTGIQDTTTRITFTENSRLIASPLLITEKINTFGIETVLARKNLCHASSVPSVNCVITGPVSANVFRVGGNILLRGNGKVCGWNLVDFEERRLSRSRPQTVTGDYSFGSLDVLKHITVETLNGFPLSKLKETPNPEFYDLEDLKKLLLSGEFVIDELYIAGNIHTTEGVNSLNLAQVAHNAVKLTGSNRFLGSLVFEDILNVSALHASGPVNGFDLAFMVEDAVFKNRLEPLRIFGRKVFNSGFSVSGNIITNNLNGIDPSKILTRTSPLLVQGPIRVLGNVHAGNVNVTGLLNGIPIAKYQNRYKLLSEGRHQITGNARFLPGVLVDDLSVMQQVYGVHFNSFVKSVVMKNEASRISGVKTFLNKVIFRDVDVTGLVNNLALNEAAHDVVLYNDENPVVVKGRITFAKTLTAGGGVSLSENLDATELDGCFLGEWLENAIYLDQPSRILGVKKFSSMGSSSDLKLSYINAVDLSKVIPLNASQDIPANIHLLAAAVQHNLHVVGLVNGKKLQAEFENTLMSSGNQMVTAPKTFLNGITVQGNLLTDGNINGRNIRNVVTLQGDEIIKGPLKFHNMLIKKDLKVMGLISDLNVQKWKERAFLKNSTELQVVTGAWNVTGYVKFMGNVGGRGLLDGEDVHGMVDSVFQTRQKTIKSQKLIKDDWVQLCHDTDALLDKARAQPFLFQQLEVVQAIRSKHEVASMHAFEALGQQYLAVSYKNNCSGAMYQWNAGRTSWDLLSGNVQNIGSIENWATLSSAGSTYLITSSDDQHSCPYMNGNVWRFEPDVKLRNVHSMNSWYQAEIREEDGHLHLLGTTGVDTLQLQDGVVSHIRSWPLAQTGRSQFVPESVGLGVTVADGKWLSSIPQDNATQATISRSANPYFPAWSRGNVATMNIANGRKLVVVSAEDSNLLVVYEDIVTGRALVRMDVHGAHSLSVMELTAPGRNGQTLLAFIENERQLRVVQYKGVEGFVDVTKSKLKVAVKEMIPVRLFARGLVNQRNFLLLRSDHQVLLLEVEMAGDPLDVPPLQCNLP